jgi:hypothetical protein
MRPFIISALAATLIGCTWVAPKQTQQASLMGYGAASALQMDSKSVAKPKRAIAAKKEGRRHRRKTITTHTKSAKSNIVPNVSSSVQLNDKSNASINAKSTVAAKTETPQPPQPDSTSNANSTAAAKTETAQSSQLDDKSDANYRSEDGELSICRACRDEASRKECVWEVYPHYLRLRQGQNRVRGRHWREAVSISRPRERGVHRRLQYGYLAVPQLMPSVKSGSTWSRALHPCRDCGEFDPHLNKAFGTVSFFTCAPACDRLASRYSLLQTNAPIRTATQRPDLPPSVLSKLACPSTLSSKYVGNGKWNNHLSIMFVV